MRKLLPLLAICPDYAFGVLLVPFRRPAPRAPRGSATAPPAAAGAGGRRRRATGAISADRRTGTTGGTGATALRALRGARQHVETRHGTATLVAEELGGSRKYLANVNVTGATADAAGVATVTFTVMNGSTPVTGLTAVSAGIFKLAPAGSGLSYNRWVSYIYRPGRTVNAGYRENNASTDTQRDARQQRWRELTRTRSARICPPPRSLSPSAGYPSSDTIAP